MCKSLAGFLSSDLKVFKSISRHNVLVFNDKHFYMLHWIEQKQGLYAVMTTDLLTT